MRKGNQILVGFLRISISPVSAVSEDIEVLDEFSSCLSRKSKVLKRLGCAVAFMHSPDKAVWCFHYTSRKIKVWDFRFLVLPILFLSSEMWTLSVTLKRCLNTFSTKKVSHDYKLPLAGFHSQLMMLLRNGDGSCYLYDLKASAQTLYSCCLLFLVGFCILGSLLGGSKWSYSWCWSVTIALTMTHGQRKMREYLVEMRTDWDTAQEVTWGDLSKY